MRVAATADVHARQGEEERIRGLFGDVAKDADVLLLAGDLTDHGRPTEAEALIRGLRDIGVPVLAVLGNHDHEGGSTNDLLRVLESGGVRCLERASVVLGDVGFAGAKGFGGGFGRRIVRSFGEDALKAFVTESVVEAEGLRTALHNLPTQKRVAMTHYAPVESTLQGEPVEIHAFLGTSRLEQAVDEGGASLVVHGHAHHGAAMGKTAGGVPVYNVSIPVLRAAGSGKAYLVMDL